MTPQPLTVFSTHNDLKSLSTQDLVSLAQADQLSALQEMVHRYQKPVFIALFLLLPQGKDIARLTQDVLLRMCRNIKGLNDPGRFRFWLNQLMLAQLHEDEPGLVNMDPARPLLAAANMPPVPQDRSGNPVYRAMLALPHTERLLLVLREIQGLSYEEIAMLTGSSLARVQNGLAQARLRLQKLLPADTPSPYGLS